MAIIAAKSAVIMTYIHELAGWPDLVWSTETLAAPLARIRHKQGKHLGKMEALGTVLHKAKLWQRINPTPANERQRKVINRMLDNFKGHLTTSKYAKLAKRSNDTALRDIRELLNRGIIIKNEGGGRSTRYRLADPGQIPI